MILKEMTVESHGAIVCSWLKGEENAELAAVLYN